MHLSNPMHDHNMQPSMRREVKKLELASTVRNSHYIYQIFSALSSFQPVCSNPFDVICLFLESIFLCLSALCLHSRILFGDRLSCILATCTAHFLCNPSLSFTTSLTADLLHNSLFCILSQNDRPFHFALCCLQLSIDFSSQCQGLRTIRQD